MAVLPYTASGTRTINGDGSVTTTITIKDGNNIVRNQGAMTFPANTSAREIIKWIRDTLAEQFGKDFSTADIPASFSLQYGLPAAMRPVDLL